MDTNPTTILINNIPKKSKNEKISYLVSEMDKLNLNLVKNINNLCMLKYFAENMCKILTLFTINMTFEIQKYIKDNNVVAKQWKCHECDMIIKKSFRLKGDKNGKRESYQSCVKHKKLEWINIMHPCEMCPINRKIRAHFKNLQHKLNSLCAKHAKEVGTYELQDPCTECLKENIKVRAMQKNELNQSNKLCAKHAKLIGTFVAIKVCEMCVEEKKNNNGIGKVKGASQPNLAGIEDRCCAKHARQIGTYKKLYPCEMCPEKDKNQANYKNLKGELKKVCSIHAKEINTFEVLYPCVICIKENILVSAKYVNKDGKRCLCAKHSVLDGSHKLPNPCEKCQLITGSFANKNGEAKKLCIKCALIEGTIKKNYLMASKKACRTFDKIEKEQGIKIQHIHFDCDNDISGSEFRIPGTRYHVDGLVNKNIVYEFLGNEFHGFPENHPNHDCGKIGGIRKIPYIDLYNQTMKRFEIIANMGYTINYIWECDIKNIHTYVSANNSNNTNLKNNKIEELPITEEIPIIDELLDEEEKINILQNEIDNDEFDDKKYIEKEIEYKSDDEDEE